MVGAGLHAFNLLGGRKSYSHHLSAIADGALSSYLTTTGYRVGQRWSDGAGFTIAVKQGFMGSDAKAPAGGASIADKELASLVRAE